MHSKKSTVPVYCITEKGKQTERDVKQLHKKLVTARSLETCYKHDPLERLEDDDDDDDEQSALERFWLNRQLKRKRGQ